jgi:multidrug efflux pump subunit AcrB
MGLDQLANVLSISGTDVPGGRLAIGLSEVSVKTVSRFESLDELRQVVIASGPGASQVRLADVAQVIDGYKDADTITRLNGLDAVAFEVQKQGGSNTVAIADNVYKTISKLEKVLPPDVKIQNAIDAARHIRRDIDNVTEALILGGLMAVFVIFLFMLDWRSTFISALALPTSVVTTFFVMWLLGFSFNMMSLLGLSLAIGLLIDDAVVVRENIFRHMEAGENPINAARKGTAEIGLAVMATTFAIVAVFVPIAFMQGIVGRFFKQFGLTVAAAVMVSLFISFTLDPMMSARVMKPIAPGHHAALYKHRVYGRILRMFDAMNDAYRALLVWALSHRKTVVAMSVALFIGSLSLMPFMGKEFFSPGDRGEFRISLELPARASLAETELVTKKAEEIIRQNKYVRNLYTQIGVGGEVHKARVRVYTTPAKERPEATQRQIQEDIRKRLAAVPALRFNIADIGLIEGGDQELPITLYVRGDDYEKLKDIAKETLKIVSETNGVADADMSYRSGKPEYVLKPDRARVADLGIDALSIGRQVRLAIEGEPILKYRDGDKDYDVRLRLSKSDLKNEDAVSQIALMARANPQLPSILPRLVKISDVADVKQAVGPSTIERMNRQRQIIVTANVSGRSLGVIVGDIEARLKGLELPDGFSFAFGGQTERMKETFSNMGLALLVAIVFIYLVLASQFESFIHPLTIMVTLPLAIVGALLGLFLANYSIGMPAMIGIVLLMGLVTKNAILLIDYTNTLRSRGYEMIDALLLAGPVRLRPILMTSAAMVLGMLPNVFSTGESAALQGPMSLAVIGGVITSTFLTLIVVPVIYVWMDRFTLKSSRHGEPAVNVQIEEAKTSFKE